MYVYVPVYVSSIEVFHSGVCQTVLQNIFCSMCKHNGEQFGQVGQDYRMTGRKTSLKWSYTIIPGISFQSTKSTKKQESHTIEKHHIVNYDTLCCYVRFTNMCKNFNSNHHKVIVTPANSTDLCWYFYYAVSIYFHIMN